MKYQLFVALNLLISLLLAACTPSQAEIETQATQVAGAVLATLTAQAPEPTPTPSPTAPPTSTPEPTATATPTPGPLAAAQIFSLISPAIAFVDTPAGTGSGMLTEGGYLVTNAHVVWPFEKVRVVFPDGQEYLDAPVLSWDLVADLAVVGPLETSITPIKLGKVDDPIVGGDVYLIGYPGEVEEFPQPTMSRGLISRFREWESIELTYFQVDATVTGGQSGGVLISEMGEVIGISGFLFSEAEYGLVASTADMLPRLKKLMAAEEAIGFSDRRVTQAQGKLEHDFTLNNERELRTYILNEPVGTEVDITVDGKNYPGFGVFDLFGEVVASAEDGDSQAESASVTVDIEAPYFIELFQFSSRSGDFHISSSHDLIPYDDPDDNMELKLEQTVLANVDTPADIDTFVIELEEDETIQVKVDSVLVDPQVTVYYEGARKQEVISDDDSGGGIFGLNPEVIYKAPRTGSYLIEVRNADYSSMGGYFLTVAEAPADAPLTAPEPSTTLATSYGSMELYESYENPFNIRYPAAWSDQSDNESLCRFGTACFSSRGGGTLIITEDDFKTVGLDDMSLSKYTDATLSMLESNGKEFKLISREQITTLQGLPVEVLDFTYQKGLFKASRLIYIHDNGVAFNATYLTGAEGFDKLESLIDYSFGTFRVWEPGEKEQSAVFHLDEGIKFLASDEVEAAIEAFTTAIELNPSLVEAYTRRAGAHQVDGDLTKALADSQKAIELRPDDPELYYDRGSINWQRLDYPQALLDMEQALQLDPELPGVYNMRALIQTSQGNYEDALASINQAMSLESPTSAPLLDTRGYIYLKLEQPDQAKADYEAIFDQGLRFPYALLGAGLAYEALGDADKAIELLEEGLAAVEDREMPDPQLADLINMAEKSLEQLQTETKKK